LMKGKL